jgi:DNA-binding phage protein
MTRRHYAEDQPEATMQYMGEIELLTKYVRGVVAGPRIHLDAVDEQAVEVLRREPLHAWLLRIARAGCKVRGARGNSVREVIELLAQVHSQSGISQVELARRAGISRGRLGELFGPTETRPLMETIVRIAVGLNFPLEVVAQGEHLDDGPAPTSPSASTFGRESDWQQAGTFAACMLGGALVPSRGSGVLIAGCGLVGAMLIGYGLAMQERQRRERLLFAGAGVSAGAMLAAVVRHLYMPVGQSGGRHGG